MRQRDLVAIGSLFLFGIIQIVLTWAVTAGVGGFIVMLLVYSLYFFIVIVSINHNWDISTITAFPVFLSAFQNIFLGILSPSLTSSEIQLLTTVNFLFSLLLLTLLVSSKRRDLISRASLNRSVMLVMIFVTVYSLISFALFSSHGVVSAVASYRNVISVFIFLLIGMLGQEQLDYKKLSELFLAIGCVVILFGFVEVFAFPDIWRSLNITDLWTKKGITLQPSGIPTNFYSSETIHGERIRRMSSTFADPVNLGTYLLVIFVLCWQERKFLLGLLTIVAIGLTVSKGAFLGILIFICVYALYYLSRKAFLLVITFSGVAGLGFVVYAIKAQANSMFLHISGFLASLTGIFRHPLGSGLGSQGVLARQFTGVASTSGITETGLGMIIGQLGIVGLFSYIAVFIWLFRKRELIQSKRKKTVYLTLLFSIFFNIVFNEVALSPNSCGSYMLLIGLIVSDAIYSGGDVVR